MKKSVIEAIELVKSNIEAHCYVVEEEIVENEVAWYIPYFDPQQVMPIAGAHFGFLVEKQSLELHRLGSGLEIEVWLEGYKIGIAFKVYDLVITKIHHEADTFKYLKKLQLMYYKIEESGGTIWRIPKIFSDKMLKERLKNLPCCFRNQHLSIQVFIKIIASKAFEFELNEVLSHERIGRGELLN